MNEEQIENDISQLKMLYSNAIDKLNTHESIMIGLILHLKAEDSEKLSLDAILDRAKVAGKMTQAVKQNAENFLTVLAHTKQGLRIVED